VLNVVKEEKLKDPSFAAILEQCVKHPLAKNLDLGAFLILPVQRIPRYVLLLTDLIKNTTEDHLDYTSIHSALQMMKTVADHVEEFIAAAENREKCLAIQNSFDQLLQKEIEIIKPHRKFLYEGNLIKQCRKERKERRFYLFSDCLIYAHEGVTGKYIFSGEIPLSELSISDLEDDAQFKNTLKIESKTRSFLVFATSREDKSRWNQAISDAIGNNEKKKRNFPIEIPTTSEKAKIWVPDSQVTNCKRCNEGFSLLNRKHHCRKCGEVICNNCSKKEWKSLHLVSL